MPPPATSTGRGDTGADSAADSGAAVWVAVAMVGMGCSEKDIRLIFSILMNSVVISCMEPPRVNP
jgi:hypothetical protein